jgi:hypothetical protein
MKLTTVIAVVAALFVGTQSADAGLLDFLNFNVKNNKKCKVHAVKPKCAKPAAPKAAKCAKPAAPKVRKPSAPKCAKPAAPKSAKCAKPAAPKVAKCAKPAAPKTATKGCEYEKKTSLLPRIRLPQIRRISLPRIRRISLFNN